jgi:hypothetical protein
MGKTKPSFGVVMVAASVSLAGWLVFQMADAWAAGGIAPYFCMFSDGARSYQDAPCGKQPDPSARYYDARGNFIDRSTQQPDVRFSGQPATSPASPTSVPAVCRKQRHVAESDLKADLAGKYGNSYSLQLTLLNSNMEAYDAICSTPAPPVTLRIVDELASKYYPSFSLIRTLAISNAKAYKELHQ